MAYKNRAKVWLGYDDESITAKNRSQVTFWDNKMGGKPILYNNDSSLPHPLCKLCGLNHLLVLQIHSTLDNSKYYRTLYIFACINPNCWNRNESWSCLRVQCLKEDSINESECQTVSTPSTTSWLASADDWGDDGNDNLTEPNGNNMLSNKSCEKLHLFMKASDLDEGLHQDLLTLRVDDPNANSPINIESPGGGGAVGRLDSPQACAEIEGEESEVVCIDTPTQPQCNLMDLLSEVTPHPLQNFDQNTQINLTFAESFIGFDEEDLTPHVDPHVRDTYLQYETSNPDLQMNLSAGSNDTKGNEANVEKYEKSVPRHGDEMFYHFYNRIGKNPGQLVRFSRDNSAPLLLHPLGANVGSCKYCGGERIFEIQVLPTIINKLRLMPHNEKFELEFGTVLVFTCARSCWSSNDIYKEENVIVQAERIH